MSAASHGIVHTHHFDRQEHKTFIVLFSPFLGFDIHHPSTLPLPISTTEKRQLAHTHSAGLSSIGPIPPCPISNKYLFLPSFVNVCRSCRTACRRSVTCYPTPVSHSCAMLCNANMLLPPDFFGPPYQEKRDTGAYFRFVYFLCAFL